MLDAWWVLPLRMALAAAFLLAGWAKLSSRDEFSQTVRRVTGATAYQARLIAVSLPWLEIVLGTGLAVGIALQPFAALATGVLLIFSAVVVVALARGIRSDCRCFGRLFPSAFGPQALMRNVLLMAMSTGVAVASADPLSKEVSSTFASGARDYPWLLALMSIGGAFCLIVIEQLIETMSLLGAPEETDVGTRLESQRGG